MTKRKTSSERPAAKKRTAARRPTKRAPGKRTTATKPTRKRAPKGTAKRPRREAPGGSKAPTLQEVVTALQEAALIRAEEVALSPEAAPTEPIALAPGLWSRLRRALFTRVRLGPRHKPLADILREAHWVDP